MRIRLDRHTLEKIDSKLTKEIENIYMNLQIFNIEKVENIEQLAFFIEYMEEVVRYISYVNILVRVKRIEGKGISSQFYKIILTLLDNIETIFSKFTDSDLNQILPNRDEDSKFMDDIDEVRKIELLRKIMIILDFFEISLDDKRFVSLVLSKRVKILGRFKNWFNLRKLFDILDNPSNPQNIVVTEFLNLFFINIYDMSKYCYSVFELSLKTNKDLLSAAYHLLGFLLKVENIHPGFFNNVDEMKDLHSFWEKNIQIKY